ncbi:MAG: hypothetical protein NTY19_43310 [Planctomycetota bacterium]|nr:hypothetical protein [Planctomycetota bacterium]
MMLVGELPDLEETQAGKDLIQIGEVRGEVRGLGEAILLFLAARYGTLPAAIDERIRTLRAEQARRLLKYLPRCQTLDDVGQWLTDDQP